jgi:hypothetical protein
MRPSSIVLALVLVASLPSNAPACSCTFLPDFDTAYAQSDAIFLGEVLGIDSAAPDFNEAVWVTVRVEADWKGAPPATVRVLTGAHDGNCGFGFVLGERYLVYALGGGTLYGPLPAGEVWTHSCWRTHSYWAEDPDLALLGPVPVAAGTWGSVKVRYR